MYKIYINDNLLLLMETENAKAFASSETVLLAPYSNNKKMLLSYIDMLEKTDRFDKIIIHYFDYKQLKSDFKSLFKIIHASGGIVKNEFDEILLIERLAKIDLPKGKLEKGEKKKSAAIREVEEETGIANIELKEKIGKMRHTYRHKKGHRILKLTHWYAMEAPKQETSPQESENITNVFWSPMSEVGDLNERTYNSIQDILNQYLQIKEKA